MSLQNSGRLLGSAGARHKLRAAVALGTVSIFGAVCIPTATAAPSAIPASSVLSTTAADVDSDADIAALEQLKANYFTNVDAKDWAGLRTLFAPDAVVDTRSSFGPIFHSRDPFITFTALTLALLSTHHVGSDPQITVTSPTTADGVWQLQDDLNVGNLVGIHGFASYSDTYEKVGDTWVVATSTLHRTRLDVVLLPGLANISFTVFDVNSENPLIRTISRALQNLVAPTSAMGAVSATSTLATSAPASTADAPAAPAAPSSAKQVEPLGAPKVATIPAEEHAKPVTTAAAGTHVTDQTEATEVTHETEANDQTEETSSGSGDSNGSSNATKPEDAGHINGVQAPNSTTKSASGPDDSNNSSNATKPKYGDHVDGANEPKKAKDAQAE